MDFLIGGLGLTELAFYSTLKKVSHLVHRRYTEGHPISKCSLCSVSESGCSQGSRCTYDLMSRGRAQLCQGHLKQNLLVKGLRLHSANVSLVPVMWSALCLVLCPHTGVSTRPAFEELHASGADRCWPIIALTVLRVQVEVCTAGAGSPKWVARHKARGIKGKANFLETVTPGLRHEEQTGASQVTVARERKVREKRACQHRGGHGVVVRGEKQAAFTSVRGRTWREVEAKRSRAKSGRAFHARSWLRW